MVVFCLLWVPLFYLFRRSILEDRETGGGIWALLLGSITAILQFFLGSFISPGGFGFSRWLFGFVEIVSLPVILPLLVYTLLTLVRAFTGSTDFANFALLWMIPVAGLRAIGWSATYDIILLVAVPVLWTAIATGIPFFINMMFNSSRWYTTAACIIGILVLPALGALVYWAFFSQHTVVGFILLFLVNVPMGISFALEITKN